MTRTNIPIVTLMKWIEEEENHQNSIFGILRENLFFSSISPQLNASYRERGLRTPLGIDATGINSPGIITAWLCGASHMSLTPRFEGYPDLESMADPWISAWTIIHVLNYKFGEDLTPGTFFNIAFDPEMWDSGPIRSLVNHLFDAEGSIEWKKADLEYNFRDIKKVRIPPCMASSVTIRLKPNSELGSLEKIYEVLLKRGTDISISLSPEFSALPDKALSLVEKLREKMLHTPGIFLESSGEHPSRDTLALASELFRSEIARESIGLIDGVSCFNFPKLIRCGFNLFQVQTDISEPGGYLRLRQYLSLLEREMAKSASFSVEEFISQGKPGSGTELRLSNLASYTEQLKTEQSLEQPESIKGSRPLGYFDCIDAPCAERCRFHCYTPQTMRHAANGNFNKAFDEIVRHNPFPETTREHGEKMCWEKCTRQIYEGKIPTRKIEKFILDNVSGERSFTFEEDAKTALVKGATPEGIAYALTLAKNGVKPTVIEQATSINQLFSEAPGWLAPHLVSDLNRLEKYGLPVAFGVSSPEKPESSFDIIYHPEKSGYPHPESIITHLEKGRVAALFDLEHLGIHPRSHLSALPVENRWFEQRKRAEMMKTTIPEGGGEPIPSQAIYEASRCLSCDKMCDICVSICPNRANASVEVTPFQISVADLKCNVEIKEIEKEEHFSIRQPYQIIHLAEQCTDCGLCRKFCPTAGNPKLDKPRLFLTEDGFNKASRGFLYVKDQGKTYLKSKGDGIEDAVIMEAGSLVYASDMVHARLDPETFKVLDIHFSCPPEMKSLRRAAVLWSVMKSIRNSFLSAL